MWRRTTGICAVAALAAACSGESTSSQSDGGSSGGASGSSGAGGSDGGVSGTAGTAGAGAASGSGGTSGTGAVSGGGGTGTGEAWWPKDRDDGCTSAGSPDPREDRPAAGSGGESIDDVIFAVNRVRFGALDGDASPAEDAWRHIGFDVDDACTRSPTCTSQGELVVERSCKNDVVQSVDGEQCRDNTVGRFLALAYESPVVADVALVNEARWNCALWRGEMGLLVRLSGWDGTPNDDNVAVHIYASTGIEQPPAWACDQNGTLNDSWKNQALPLITNHWQVADESIDPTAGPEPGVPSASKTRDDAAFVRDGWLIARMPPAGEIWLNGERAHVPGMRFVLAGGVFAARLGRSEDGLHVLEQGLVAGATTSAALVRSFEEIGFCQNFCDSYTALVQFANAYEDVLSTGDNLPDVSCDALSFAMAFSGREARADDTDVVDVAPPAVCPPPAHPAAPQHGCTCPPPGVGGACE